MNTKKKPYRLLFLNQYYPPDTSATAHVARRIVSALSEVMEVQAIVGRPSYDPTEYHPSYLLRRDTKDNVTIERVGSTSHHRHGMKGRLLNYLSYVILAFPFALMTKANAVLAMTDPPFVGILAAIVAKLRRLPFIYYIQDLHPDMALASGMIKDQLGARVWEKIHCWALRQATLVIVLGEDMRERITNKGIPPEKVCVIRSGALLPESEMIKSHPSIQDIRSGFHFTMMHAGNLGFYGAWETLIEAAKLLTNDFIGLIFVGGGAAKEKVQHLAIGQEHIKFLGFRPAEDVPFVMAAGDVQIITMRPGLEGLVVPSKLYSILAAGRPILAVVPETSDVARIIRENYCGVVASPDRPMEVADAVRKLREFPDTLQEMTRNARLTANKYELKNELNRLIRLVETIILSNQKK